MRAALAAVMAGVLAAVALVAGALPARADDGVVGRSGETVIPLTDQDIRMAELEEWLLRISMKMYILCSTTESGYQTGAPGRSGRQEGSRCESGTVPPL
jgi:hypothetical protein